LILPVSNCGRGVYSTQLKPIKSGTFEIATSRVQHMSNKRAWTRVERGVVILICCGQGSESIMRSGNMRTRRLARTTRRPYDKFYRPFSFGFVIAIEPFLTKVAISSPQAQF
jgi:hypothetical protein